MLLELFNDYTRGHFYIFTLLTIAAEPSHFG